MTDRVHIWRERQGGSTQVEFALCAIFVIFLMISMVDMTRGLWIYHTLGEAVRDGTRYSIVRGSRYVDPTVLVTPPTPRPRLPGADLGSTLNLVATEAIGLDKNALTVVFEKVTDAGIVTPYATCTGVTCGSTPLTQPWPPDDWATPGQFIGITARYQYNSMVVMYFPGGKGVQLGKYLLGSTSRASVVF